VITELEVMRLLERADPVHGGLDAPVADAGDYLDALLARDRASVVVEFAPNRFVDPAEVGRRRGPVQVAPAGRGRPQVLRLTAAAALIAALAASLTLVVSDRNDGGPAVAPGGAVTQGQGLIAFLGDVSGTPGSADFRSEVYVVRADGTGLRKLTDTPDVGELVPVWSPDGTRLAFLRDVDEMQQGTAGATVVVVDPTTGEEILAVEFPRCGPNCDPSAGGFGWSSDGRTITVFVGNRGLHLLDVETRNWRGSLGAPFVSWSPTGKWVLIDRWGDSPLLAPAAALDDADPLAGGTELLGHHDSRYAWDAASWAPDEAAFAVAFDINRTLDGDERIDVFLTDGGDFYSFTSGYAPAWSPKGDRIAFRRNPGAGGVAELWVKGPGGDTIIRGRGVPVGSAEHQVDTGVLAHAWSPDGSMLAYLRTAAGGTGTELWVASADGSNPHRVGESTIAPAWSPDGALLLGYHSDGIFTVRPDGTDRTVLTANADVTEAVWQPAPGNR
jgi:hypothetical protein